MKSNAAQPSQRSLGMLIAAPCETPAFRYGIGLAEAAQKAGVQVFLYLLDDAVAAANCRELRVLAEEGVKISACAYAAQRRSMPLFDHVTYGGLSMLNDLILHSDRFVGFCR